MLTLVHLSDIHFTAGESGLAKRNASLRVDVLNDLRACRESRGSAAVILVTGDIAYSGLPAEYEAAREWLDLVAEACGAPRTAVLVVPGNHDVHRKSVTLAGRTIHELMRTQKPDSTDGVVDRLIAEDFEFLMRPLKNYNEFAAEYSCEMIREPHWELSDVPLDERHSVAFRGLNTVLASNDTDERPRMVLGRTQAILPMDRPGRIYVVLGHHPPDWWTDSDAVLGSLRGRCSLMLSGHKHVQMVEQVDQMLRVTAGAVHPEEDLAWQPRYNWIDLDIAVPGDSPPLLRVVIWPRVFRENRFDTEYQSGGKAYLEYELAIPLPALPHVEEPSGLAAEVSSQPTREEPALAPVMLPARPALVEPTGELSAERNTVRTLLRLPYPSQMRILHELRLLEDDDLNKSHIELVRSALDRASARGLQDELAGLVVVAEEMEKD